MEAPIFDKCDWYDCSNIMYSVLDLGNCFLFGYISRYCGCIFVEV
jgi:hypothetical protein